MSVINQMLKDLAERKRTPNAEMLTVTNGSILMTQKKYSKKSWMLAFGILIMLIGLLQTMLIFKKTSDTVKSAVIERVSPKEETLLNSTDFNLSDTTLTGMTLQVQEGKTFLRLLLNQKTLYRIMTKTSSQLILVLEHTQFKTSLPALDSLPAAIKNIEVKTTQNGDLKMILSLRDNAELLHLSMSDNLKLPELQIDFTNGVKPAPNESVGVLRKELIRQNANDLYHEALLFKKNSDLNKTIQVLTNLMKEFPDFLPGPALMVNVLLEQEENTKATLLLKKLLTDHPTYLPYIELQARLWMNEGKLTDALQLLNKIPHIENQPNLYAMLAALYERLGKSVLAATIYEQLLAKEPNNSSWWTGFAIALENSNHRSQAIEAYQRARDSQDLNPELRAYVSDRLQNLQS